MRLMRQNIISRWLSELAGCLAAVRADRGKSVAFCLPLGCGGSVVERPRGRVDPSLVTLLPACRRDGRASPLIAQAFD
jgi:hypothetical protein